MDTRAKRLDVEAEQYWISEAETMPWLHFPPEWQVKIIPPFSDVDIRFQVKLPSGLEKFVFLDSRQTFDTYYDKAGHPIPYWEVSPVAGKVGRCGKFDIEILLELIGYEEEEGN